MSTVRSFCRICTSICGILVDVEGDQIVRVRGDHDHPFSRGYTCAKGRALPALHHHPDRIERPLLAGRPTGWDECLDDLGDRLRAIVDEDGPAAVGIFFGSGVGMDAAGYRMAESLHRAIGTPARFSPLTIDGTAKVLVSDLVGGSPGLNPRPDREAARCVLFVGVNPVVSHGHTVAMPDPVSTLRAMREHAELWVLDPRRTETARLATGHLAPRPGTDHAVLAFLCREVLAAGVDPEVLARCSGVDELAAAVEPFTLAHAAEVAGVGEDELAALRDAVQRAGRVAVETGTGVTMSAAANVTQWLSWALMALTDAMNRPGGVWFHPGFAYALESFELPISPPEGGLFAPGPASRPDTQGFLGEWPCGALVDEIEAGNIRAVLNLGGHLVTAFPDTGRLVPALERLDVLATIEIVANQTTALSTHVLPTKDQLERADITLWDILLPRIAGQHTPAVVEPVGERRSTWWVLAELGRRLGHDLVTDGALDDDTRLAGLLATARVPYDELAEQGWGEVPHEIPADWVDAHVERLGGWRLAPALLVRQLAELREPAPLVLIPRRQVRKLNSQFDLLDEPPEIHLHPDDAAAHHLLDHEPVIVRSTRGELTGVTRVDPTIRAGTVSVPHGHEAANVNRLTDKDDLDAVTGMAHYSGIPVRIGPR